jgi:F-type H+-transporting ATPase subunit a
MASPLHQFEIHPIIPFHAFGVDLSFTNSALWMAIAAVVSLGFLIFSTESRKLVPDRGQAASEKFYTLVQNMIRENTGEKGMQYFPLIFTVFLVVLMGNLLGLIPYSFTYTSHLAVTAMLAIFIFLLVTVISIVKHGFHFFSIFNPPGVPLLMKPLVIPLEIVSYLTRPVTHAFRLFANMMAGHLVVKVFAGFSVSLATFGIAVGLFPALFNVLIYILEALVAVLQAYVFAILTCIYFKDAVDLHH